MTLSSIVVRFLLMEYDHPISNKIAVVVAVPEQVRYFLVNHIVSFSGKYNVTIISNLSHNSDLLNILPKEVQKHHIPILREISLFEDMKAFLSLMRYFYREKFRVVYSVSPKAGLLSMLAAWFVRVPVRIHTFTGQVWVKKKGIIRLIFKLIDRVMAMLATVVVVDSFSQRDFLIKNNVISAKKSLVLADGSISGVDLERFHPNLNVRNKVREETGVAEQTIVYLFVGRLKRDKGVLELTKAFLSISGEMDNIALWFVGPDEDNIKGEIKSIMQGYEHLIRLVPYTTAPEDYMASSDILCLPSHREGFGCAIIEAAACGIPAIGTRIYGIIDAIIDNETGILVDKGNVGMLASALRSLGSDFSYRERLGQSAKRRVLEKFNQQIVSDELMLLIKNQIDNV